MHLSRQFCCPVLTFKLHSGIGLVYCFALLFFIAFLCRISCDFETYDIVYNINKPPKWSLTCTHMIVSLYMTESERENFRLVFHDLYQNLPGRCLVCKYGSHVINIPKADWSSMKNKQLTATPC